MIQVVSFSLSFLVCVCVCLYVPFSFPLCNMVGNYSSSLKRLRFLTRLVVCAPLLSQCIRIDW